jgi:type I restriction enzyme, S subunit
MFISQEANEVLGRSEVHAGDILITITGNVGRVVYLDKSFGSANINQHIARIRIIDTNVYDQYVFHFLLQTSTKKYYGSITTGQAYPQIRLQQVRDTRVPLPPLHEQRTIAATLSDVDALISGLDQIIAKKRDLKQAAMQQLLTGKQRLPGFRQKPGYKQTDLGVIPEDWDVKSVLSIAEVRGRVGWKGYTKADLRSIGPLAIGAKHIDDSNSLNLNDPTHISYEKYLESPEIMVALNDILIVQRGTIEKLVHINKEIW